MKIASLLYQKVIASDLTDENLRSREIVLNWLLFGLFCLAGAAFLSSFITFVFLGLTYVWMRLLIVAAILAALVGFHQLIRRRHWHQLVATVILLLLFVPAILVLYKWGILVPTGLLLLSLVVVMAGMVLGSRFSLYMILMAIFLLGFLEYGKVQGWIAPDTSWADGYSNISDVIVFSVIFSILGLTCWLFNRQIEASLNRATKAEAALLKQNEDLEAKVRARTRELEKAQLERMQNMYRFAELGHVSTALFHDLANHLSTVSLDIENLHKKTQPEILSRIDDNIHYIDAIVQRVRSQLQGKVKVETFDIKTEIREIAKVSALTATVADVTIKLHLGNSKPLLFRGDILRFRQAIINLLSNAVESYKEKAVAAEERIVNVTAKADKRHAIIEVSDHGPGIPATVRERIFDPFYSSKEKGVGIGLFIVRQVVDRDLKGEVKLTNTGPEGTIFTVRLPLKRP